MNLRLPLLLAVVAVTLASCGSSDSSSSSGSTTTVTVPGAPTIGTATAGDGSASIAFTAPTSTGGATITGYTATCTASGASRTGTGTASPISVTGLTNGTAYSCSVVAANSAGNSAASGTVSVTPAASASGGSVSTAAVDCPYSQSTLNSTVGITSTSSWTCASGKRSLTANGIPDHNIGTFPNSNNPNSISAQTVSFSATLTPSAASTTNTSAMLLGYARNGVKFDPGTAGTCPSGATSTSSCSLIDNSGTFRIEALGQTTFNFGVDTNNAHVQPGGAYHYHGMPEGLLTNAGITSSAPKMLLIGYAPDGYPVYARYGRTVATDATSALKVMTGSYRIKTTLDSGRPATSVAPAGTFLQDYEYVAGLGDLDQCNGRTDVTPEFPAGIYHYYATDTYPYLPRCWKGVIG